MEFIIQSVQDNIASITLNRGKVNPINEAFAEELKSCFQELATNPEVKAVIITGRGSFFSFGLDIPEFLGYSRQDFIRFVTKFADLYTYVFLYPKPVIASLNGHTVAGGCMLATACDYRIMASGKGKISLNEINFGSSLFPGSAEMLKYCTGQRNAETVAFTGAMFSPEEGKGLGLVDLVVSPEELEATSLKIAKEYAHRYGPAFESIKKLLRTDTTAEMKRKDELYRDEMVDIWYSESTWKQLQNIKIHG
ncbi:enoyl-CoA hydratase/isomerase family protein [Desulfomonile tiedjei]|uniref:Enoyl-CoA hydratase/carnithine racemase n=1 Tax=Desulfomonile tiedjei (strain ATCC 49306 / DSM 6799 / DCB-1) TaxID=706587 RepID=I4BZT1_DESTA|nr:enoyl-CoA hydratase/isomerase family protein [Desulfomonile tiedjei]AFM22822.1 enoyl-CoA hydratase/carnithine racemase [Desulfomonile tiedjei DSM 6799]